MSYPFLGRTTLLYGEQALLWLKTRTVAVFGLGGVGGYCAELLARAGIGKLILVDHDTVDISNINRQVFATHSNINSKKVQVAKERLLDINPEIKIDTYDLFLDEQTVHDININNIDYIIDAIDTVHSKVLLAVWANKLSVPIISSMGTANRKDTTKVVVTDIYKTDTDPLARRMRSLLRKAAIPSLKVVCSTEKPITKHWQKVGQGDKEQSGKKILATNAFVPMQAGLLLAKYTIDDLITKGGYEA